MSQGEGAKERGPRGAAMEAAAAEEGAPPLLAELNGMRLRALTKRAEQMGVRCPELLAGVVLRFLRAPLV